MSKTRLFMEWFFKLVGFLFAYMLVRQLIDAVTGNQRFIIIEIFFILAWTVGALIFFGVGFAIGSVRKSENKD